MPLVSGAGVANANVPHKRSDGRNDRWQRARWHGGLFQTGQICGGIRHGDISVVIPDREWDDQGSGSRDQGSIRNAISGASPPLSTPITVRSLKNPG
jgi:hypothetical protein